MKVVIQNGVVHGLSRRQAEAMAAIFPRQWHQAITSIVLCQSDRSTFQIKHFPKEQTLGVFWPTSAHPQPSITDVAEELLVTLAIVTERGTIPSRLGSSLRARTRGEVAALLEQCIEAIEANDA